MTKDKLTKIHQTTGHQYQDILKMTDMEFWKNITILLAKGTINKQQHDWLDRQRKTQGLEQTTIEILDLMGGKLIK